MSKQQGFCMVGGMGDTSYANNSGFQRNIIGKVKPLLEESIRAGCCNSSSEFLTIADLGCSSGTNSLAVLESIINVVASDAQSSGFRIPEFKVFLNDLHHNDFNTIFKILPSFYEGIEEKSGVGIECFISGTPGSFYDRLFPRNLVHFMHSSTCLHWLSQVPKGLMGENGEKGMVHTEKGSIYGRKGSPPEILKAYREQFADDFSMFLRCRSKEIVDGGRMLLSFLATNDEEACSIMELVSNALYKLASQGRIDREKLDGFYMTYYKPTVGQVKELIELEGSFSPHKLDTFNLPCIEHAESMPPSEVAKLVARTTRAILEQPLAREFGEEITDDVFELMHGMAFDTIASGQELQMLIIAVSLVRRA